MSCYRCGKETEPGVVECEACENGLPPFMPGNDLKTLPDDLSAEDMQLLFTVQIMVDKAKTVTREQRRLFKMAQLKFARMMGEIFIGSGLSEFCKRKKPDED